MTEVIAGLLLAIAALLWVLEPLARSARPRFEGEERTADALIGRMRSRLVAVCLSCATPGEPGAVYCRNCGKVLAAER
jgi:hypothetical protein